MAIAAGEHGGSGAFTWQQDAAVTRLSLRGPFGTGALEVTADGEAFTLADGSGQVLDAAQARSRLESRLGTALPVSNLRYWMLGVPAPGIEAQVVDSPGEPRRLIEQTGWQIRYDEFMDSQGVILPARLTATSGSVRLKVIVDAWSLAGGAPVPKP
jgi:outer membrane lipoprotein LolB